MIRLIFIILYILLFFTIGQFSLLIGFIINLFNTKLSKKFYRNVLNSVCNTILFIAGTKVNIKGLENIKDDTYFIVANHRSYFDILTLLPNLKIDVGFIAKIELKLPLLSIWMEKIDCLFIDRNDLRQSLSVINNAVNNIKNGISMIIFPEGTRNKNKKFNDMLEFKEGSFKIAKLANCKILPIAIKNADDVFEKNNYRIRKATVDIVIGSPFDISSLNENDINQIGKYTQNIILNL